MFEYLIIFLLLRYRETKIRVGQTNRKNGERI